MCAPRADVVVHDNWHVSGLCGTGSVDFELRDVFVATSSLMPSSPSRDTRVSSTDCRLARSTRGRWQRFRSGIARGAIGEFVRFASARRGGGAVPFAERELVQSQLKIEARVGAGRAYLRHAMSELLNAVESGADLVPHRVNFLLACTYASQAALSSIDLLTGMAGAISISRSCLLERYERDARAAAKHIAMSPAAYITGGKHSLGLDLSNRRTDEQRQPRHTGVDGRVSRREAEESHVERRRILRPRLSSPSRPWSERPGRAARQRSMNARDLTSAL